MEHRRVCGIVVTYHPNREMIGNLTAVVAQVSSLIVVDNGSSADELAPLRAASRALGFHLIENSENLGIAEALNQGVRWARSENFPWVLLLDQDSRITDFYVDTMLGSWEAHPHKARVVSIQPRYVDRITGESLPIQCTRDNYPLYAMTSGCLIPEWAFDAVGLFDSEYFIDYVDIEYSLRARARGYLLLESQDTILLHTSGNPTQNKLFGTWPFRPLNHSATRRYYMTRNRIVTARRYYLTFPRWALVDLFNTGKEVTKMLIGETERREKLSAMLHGAIDGIMGRMGRMPTPL